MGFGLNRRGMRGQIEHKAMAFEEDEAKDNETKGIATGQCVCLVDCGRNSHISRRKLTDFY
jgi:hypothetical protein